MLRGERGRHRDRDQRAIVVADAGVPISGTWEVGWEVIALLMCYVCCVRQCFHFQPQGFDFELLANWLLSCYFVIANGT